MMPSCKMQKTSTQFDFLKDALTVLCIDFNQHMHNFCIINYKQGYKQE